MLSSTFLLPLLLPLTTSAAETVLGLYIFSRHGDRTPKSIPPARLTDLGYSQIFTSGTYFRNRYVAPDAPSRIAGVSSDLVDYAQITASAPLDTVLMGSAQGRSWVFLVVSSLGPWIKCTFFSCPLSNFVLRYKLALLGAVVHQMTCCFHSIDEVNAFKVFCKASTPQWARQWAAEP